MISIDDQTDRGAESILLNPVLSNNERKVFNHRSTWIYMKLDITEAKTLLGFEPRVNLKEGTKAMIGWFSGKSPSGRI
ncbi:MAG: hypothetical protein E3J78_04185 [Candidatus Cloacimonadota bacterium]|nr:MAG: hypothetical protein E3J78_04185 [Candidatus Cloacimonadota bacterium]